MSDEARLEAIRRLLAEAPEGPWQWVRDYGLSDGNHWCLTDPKGAANGTCLDGQLVTHTTMQYDPSEDGVDGEWALLSDRPLWRFLAGSWQAVRDLVRMVDERDAVIADMLEESRHFEAGRRAGLAVAAARLRGEAAEMLRRHPASPAGRLMNVANTLEADAASTPPPLTTIDALREQNRLMLRLLGDFVRAFPDLSSEGGELGEAWGRARRAVGLDGKA